MISVVHASRVLMTNFRTSGWITFNNNAKIEYVLMCEKYATSLLDSFDQNACFTKKEKQSPNAIDDMHLSFSLRPSCITDLVHEIDYNEPFIFETTSNNIDFVCDNQRVKESLEEFRNELHAIMKQHFKMNIVSTKT
jgi:hypothetical protein